jgi:tetratricopeptide (TPR) repeat protein
MLAEPEDASKPVETAENLSAEAYLADQVRRKQLERDLIAMGMSAEEIKRLLAANSHTTEPTKEELQSRKPSMPLPPPTKPASNPSLMRGKQKPNPNRVTEQHLQSFAAELMAQRSEKQTQAVVEASKDLPEFRESSMEEKREGENLLREASLLRRREKFGEAEVKCRAALEKIPNDAPALELLGDILAGVARIDEALAAYKRATEADPKRTSAEKKYANLFGLQQEWGGVDPEAVQANPWVPTLLSALCPGLGQFANGDWIKGIVILFSILGIYYYRTITHIPMPKGKIDWNTLTLLFLAGSVWLYGIADAMRVSKEKARS